MTLTQPAAALEKSCNLADGTLADLGLFSLQDIMAYTETAFIHRFRADLTQRGARRVYRTARAGQQQLIKLYHSAARSTSLSEEAFLTNDGSKGLNSVFDNDAPTWTAQFPEKNVVVPPGSIADSSSPASYAASLYSLATRLEGFSPAGTGSITLATRRPDIADTLLNDVTVNQVVPELDIVNGALQKGLDNPVNNKALVTALQQQMVLPASMTSLSSGELLARLHYPGSALPWHEPHDQVMTGLAARKTSLSSVTRAVREAQPAFCSEDENAALSGRLLLQASGLSPAMVSLVTAAPLFATFILDMTALAVPGPLPGTNGWGTGSFTELLLFSDDRFAFVVPSQALAKGPESLAWDSNFPPLTLTLDNQQNLTLDAGLFGGGWDGINAADGGSFNRRVPVFHYNATHNPDLKLNSTPLRGQILLQGQRWADKSFFTAFTLGVVLSSNKTETFSTLLTPVQQAFFPYNYGQPDASQLPQLPVFTQATGLSVNEVMNLLCAAGTGANNTSVVASGNIVLSNKIFTNGNSSETFLAPYHYGAVFIHGGKLPRLSLKQDAGAPVSIDGLSITQQNTTVVLYDRYDRINRMVRLQRQTGLQFDQLDTLVVSAMRAEGQNNLLLAMNTHTARALGFYQRWHEAYGLTAEDMAALLHEVTPFAVGTALPQYDRVFCSCTGQPPLKIDNGAFNYAATDGADAVTVRQLCAALHVSAAEFQVLAALVNGAQKLAAGQLVRSFPVVSALYRLSRVASLLGLRVAEMCALLAILPHGSGLTAQMAGVPQLATLDGNGQPTAPDMLDDLQALADMVSWMQEQRLGTEDLVMLLSPATVHQPAGAAEVMLVNDINQHLSNACLTATALQHLGLPATDTAGAAIDWWSLLSASSGGVSDQYGLVMSEDIPALNTSIKSIVNAQKLSDGDKATAITALQTSLDGLLTAQWSLADTLLGKALGVSHGTVLAMLPCLKLRCYTLLNLCQTLNKPGLAPSDIPETLMTPLSLLARYGQMVGRWRLTPATLNAMSSLPAAFGGDVSLKLQLLPVMAAFDRWRRAAGREDRVLQYLHDVNTTPPLDAKDAATRLAGMLGAEVDEVQAAADLVTGSAAGAGRISTVPQVGQLMALLDCSSLTGLSVSLLSGLTALDIAEAVLKDGTSSDASFLAWRDAGLAVMAAADGGAAQH